MSVVSRRALLAACSSALALLAPASAAHAVGNGFNPAVTPAVLPGTTTAVDAWKLVGTACASQVQVAPRWIIGSAHCTAAAGATFDRPGGLQAKVIWSDIPLKAGSTTDRAADIAVSLLDQPLPAPAGGFPLLVSDDVGFELADQLSPGSVLWAGHGGAGDTPFAPRSQWATPGGDPVTAGGPEFQHISGDSGSAGFWYRNATARPVVGGVVVGAGSHKSFGADVRYGQPIPATDDGTFATVGAWLKHRIASRPEAAGPTWTSLAAQGVNFAALKPYAPRDLKVTQATPTSATFTWLHPADSRVARTGYKLQFGGTTVVLPAGTTTYTRTGLVTGQAYTFTLRATNANGDTPAASIPSVDFTPRPNPSAVSGLTVTPRRWASSSVYGSGGPGSGVDYCLEATWQAATIPAPSAITRYEVFVNGVDVSDTRSDGGPQPTLQVGPDGKHFARRCGLTPGSQVTVGVRAVSDQNRGPVTQASAAVPTGAPLGTPLGKPTAFTVRPLRALSSSGLDYCVALSWTAPAAVNGFPITGYSALAFRGDSYGVGSAAAGATSLRICGLNPDRLYGVTLYAQFAEGGQTTVEQQARTLTGAPNGTPVSGPSAITSRGWVENDLGNVGYCASVNWTAPEVPAGLTSSGFALELVAPNGTVVRSSGIPAGTGERSSQVCGLQPGTQYGVKVIASYASEGHFFAGISTSSSTATTPAGAAPGTPWPKPTITAAPRFTSATGDRCVNVYWPATASITGFPPSGYAVLVQGGGFTAGSDELPATARTVSFCGVPASALRVTLYAKFAGGSIVTSALTTVAAA